MVTINNDIPVYAEQITINEEVEQIQEILSQFKQPVPSNFVELEQLNWMCSTQGWKEPLCERYNCLIKGEWSQVDISHTLLEKLKLTKVKNIPYPVHISSAVLNKGLDRYFAYNVEDKEEIFLQKSFTVENLEEDINKLFDKIKDLERELEKETQSFTHELKGEKQMGQSQKEFYRKKIQYLKDQLNQIQNERDALPNLPTLNDYLLLQTERDNIQTLLGIDDLNNLPTLLGGETLASLLTRPTQTQLNDLSREKEQELTTKNTQITNLTQQVNAWNSCFPFANGNPSLVKAEIDDLNNKLQKEQKWWDKWFSYDNNNINISSYGYDRVVVSEIKKNLSQLDVNTRYLSHDFSMQGSFIYENQSNSRNNILESRKIFKAIYMYFRDR